MCSILKEFSFLLIFSYVEMKRIILENVFFPECHTVFAGSTLQNPMLTDFCINNLCCMTRLNSGSTSSNIFVSGHKYARKNKDELINEEIQKQAVFNFLLSKLREIKFLFQNQVFLTNNGCQFHAC